MDAMVSVSARVSWMGWPLLVMLFSRGRCLNGV